LKDRYVEVIGLKNKDKDKLWRPYRETLTGGVTPTANSSDKTYNLFAQYKDTLKTIIEANKIYQGNKPVLTLKEHDFREREALI
ncbi:superantigen-like protein, partial [Staphylococcus aureus]